MLTFFLAYLLYFVIQPANFSISAICVSSTRTAVSWSSSEDHRKEEEVHSHYLLHRSTCRERFRRIQLAIQHILIAKRYQKIDDRCNKTRTQDTLTMAILLTIDNNQINIQNPNLKPDWDSCISIMNSRCRHFLAKHTVLKSINSISFP